MGKNTKQVYASLLTASLAVGAFVAPADASTATPDLIPVEVEVVNNVGKKDTVKIKNIPANATVKVYLGATDYVPAYDKKRGTTAGELSTSLSYDLPTITEPTGKIYISVTPEGAKKEAPRQEFSYDREIKTDDVTLDADNTIEVFNNSGSDTARITLATPVASSDKGTEVRVGAAVNIYDTDENLLGTGKVASKGKTGSITNITLTEKLPEPAAGAKGKVMVTFANTNQTETTPIAVEYATETTSSVTGVTLEVNNGVTVKDNVTVKGLDPNKTAKVAVYSADPTGLTAAELKKVLIASGTSKVTETVDPADETATIKESSALANLSNSKGYAGIFPELDAESKVFVTVTYENEHTSTPLSAVVTAEKQTALVIGDAIDADTGTVVVETTNNSTGADLVTIKGAQVGAAIKVFAPDGTTVVGTATVAKPKAGEETLTNVSIAKSFSSNTYEANSADAKYQVTVTNKNELTSEAKEFTVANALETQFAINADNTVASNNVTIKDTIEIQGLAAKSTVTVYSADPTGLTAAEAKKLVIGAGTTTLAKSTDATGNSKVTISKNFANTSTEDKVFVEVTEFNSVSKITEVAVPKEAVTATDGATITVLNSVTKDTVTVSGLMAKDIVKVYTGLTADGQVDTKTLVGTATAKTVKDVTEVKIPLTKQFTTKRDASAGEVFYVTIQNDNKVPVFASVASNPTNAGTLNITDKATAASIAVPAEDVTGTPTLTFADNKITATSFGFNITGGEEAFPLKAADIVKIYTTEDATKAARTLTITAAQVTANSAISSVALGLAKNTAVDFWYTVTSGDTHESAKVKSSAIFAKTATPTVTVAETTAKKVADVTVVGAAKGDVIKVYDGTRVIKTVTASEAGDKVVSITGVTMDNDYKVTVTGINKAESAKATAAVLAYVTAE